MMDERCSGEKRCCIFSIPEIFKMALLNNSSAIFLFHTHLFGEVYVLWKNGKITGKKVIELLNMRKSVI